MASTQHFLVFTHNGSLKSSAVTILVTLGGDIKDKYHIKSQKE